MNRLRKSISVFALTTATTAAVATPIVLDTPSKAAAGVLTAHYLGLDYGQTFVERNLTNLTTLTRQIGTFALLRLGATTTPAATLAGTVTVPCPLGGAMRAKLAPATWLLRIEFADCRAADLDGGSGMNTYGGVMELDLPRDSFTPSTVQLLRAGSSSSYMKHLRELTSGSLVRLHRLYNVTLSGDIPIVASRSGLGILGSFSYKIDGFSDTRTQVFSDPALPPVRELRDRSIGIGLNIRGTNSLTSGDSIRDDGLYLLDGVLTERKGLGPTTESVLKPNNVFIHQVHYLLTGRRLAKLSGGLEFTWHPSDGAGC